MDIEDWQPPSEAEMKIIKARQERSSKISQLMSTYLLKGYKMLGSVCSVCDTILLQDRQGQNYCVACSELDSDGDKDNPVVNEAAATSLVRELSSGGTKQKEGPTATSTNPVTHSLSRGDVQAGLRLSEPPTSSRLNEIASPQPSAMRAVKIEAFEQGDGAVGSFSYADCNLAGREQADLGGRLPHRFSCYSTNMDILLEKVDWACQAVKETRDVDYCMRLCHMIKAAAEAIEALKKANI